ncbi:MAG: hypothetical protein GX166_09235 [Clostridiaceae bacterium]|nr:hypothetical protein [Clostridiaceae bacterium]
MIHNIVCYDDKKYSAWPANGGLWNWGDEILVSFNRGSFNDNSSFHRVTESSLKCVSIAVLTEGLPGQKKTLTTQFTTNRLKKYQTTVLILMKDLS